MNIRVHAAVAATFCAMVFLGAGASAHCLEFTLPQRKALAVAHRQGLASAASLIDHLRRHTNGEQAAEHQEGREHVHA